MDSASQLNLSAEKEGGREGERERESLSALKATVQLLQEATLRFLKGVEGYINV